MKKYLLPLAVAAFCGFQTASALDAEAVQVTLKAKPSELRAEPVYPPAARNDPFSSKKSDTAQPWFYIRIPVLIEGKAKNSGSKGPDFVNNLKVHIYTAFHNAKGDDMVLMDKEVTYVEIPLSSSVGKAASKTETNVGVFISPSNASKILGDNNKLDLGGKLAGIALEASFNGSECMNTKEENSVLVGHDNGKLNGKWWKKTHNKSGAVLAAISETPFAPFYSPVFPPTSPLYGAAEGGSAAGGSTTGYTPSSATTDDSDTSADDSKDTDATDADDSGNKKKKKNKKNK